MRSHAKILNHRPLCNIFSYSPGSISYKENANEVAAPCCNSLLHALLLVVVAEWLANEHGRLTLTQRTRVTHHKLKQSLGQF